MAQEVIGRPGIPERILMMSSVSTPNSHNNWTRVIHSVNTKVATEYLRHLHSGVETPLTHDGQGGAEVGLAPIGVCPGL